MSNIPKTGIDAALPAHPIMVILVDDRPMIAESLRRMLDDEEDIGFHYCPEASKALSTVCRIRPADVIARYGGEEIEASLPGTDAAGARTLSEKMRKKVEEMKTLYPDSRASEYVTIRTGVTGTIPNRKDPPASLIQKADKALYRAKKTGCNRTVIAGRKT